MEDALKGGEQLLIFGFVQPSNLHDVSILFLMFDRDGGSKSLEVSQI